MIKEKKIDGGIITYNDDQSTRDAVFERILAWFIKVDSFDGESIMHCDKSQIEAPILLSELADNVFEFDTVYDD